MEPFGRKLIALRASLLEARQPMEPPPIVAISPVDYCDLCCKFIIPPAAEPNADLLLFGLRVRYDSTAPEGSIRLVNVADAGRDIPVSEPSGVMADPIRCVTLP